VTKGGVMVIGAGNLAAKMASAASAAFSSNVSALLLALVHDGVVQIDLDDPVHAGVVVTLGGKVVHRGAALAERSAMEGGSS